jgi:hypothetical protein
MRASLSANPPAGQLQTKRAGRLEKEKEQA